MPQRSAESQIPSQMLTVEFSQVKLPILLTNF